VSHAARKALARGERRRRSACLAGQPPAGGEFSGADALRDMAAVAESPNGVSKRSLPQRVLLNLTGSHRRHTVILRERTPVTFITTEACARPKDLCRVARSPALGSRSSPSVRQTRSFSRRQPLPESSLRSGASLRKSTLVDGLATPSQEINALDGKRPGRTCGTRRRGSGSWEAFATPAPFSNTL
jgi:hypothetical protein